MEFEMIDGIEIVHVVAFDQNNAIGLDNKLAWDIPDDLKHFREKTSNGIVLMGRKTFESIGKALPHRENVVVSGNYNWFADNVIRFGRLDTAVAYCVSLAKHQNKKSVFIIGGAEIYKQTLEIIDTIEATQVGLSLTEADAYYPEILETTFTLIQEEEHIDSKTGVLCKFRTYKKN